MERIKKKMEHARKYREALQHDSSQTADGLSDNKSRSLLSRNRKLHAMQENSIWFLSGMAVAIVAIIIGGWRISGKWPGDILASSPGGVASSQTGGSAGLPGHASEIDNLRENIDYLNERLKMVTDSVTYLEGKLTRAHVITDSMINTENKLASAAPQKQRVTPEIRPEIEKYPPPAAGITDTATARDKIAYKPARESATVVQKPDARAIESSSSDKPAGVVASKPMGAARKTKLDTVKGTSTREPVRLAAIQPAAIAGKKHDSEGSSRHRFKTGPWVINLISSPSKTDTDRLAKKARSRDIQTEQQQITVKGTQYWRLQITGFSTTAAARAYADIAKEKLGLKDVWIMKR